MGENMKARYEVQLVVSYDGGNVTEDVIQALEDAGMKVAYLAAATPDGEFYPEYMCWEA
jgi:hypothetical protein